MTYYAYFALYCNCSIWDNIEKTIEADSLEEAQKLAKELANAIEAEYSARESDDDWWADLEEIITEDEK